MLRTSTDGHLFCLKAKLKSEARGTRPVAYLSGLIGFPLPWPRRPWLEHCLLRLANPI